MLTSRCGCLFLTDKTIDKKDVDFDLRIVTNSRPRNDLAPDRRWYTVDGATGALSLSFTDAPPKKEWMSTGRIVSVP